MVSRSGLTVAKGQILVSTTSLEKRKIAGVLVCLRKYVGGAKNGADLSHDDPPEFYHIGSLNSEKRLSSSRFSELRDPTVEGGAEQILRLAFRVEKGGQRWWWVGSGL